MNPISRYSPSPSPQMNTQRSGQIAYEGTLLENIQAIEGIAANNVKKKIRAILGEEKAQKLLDHAEASPNFVLNLLYGNYIGVEPRVIFTKVMQTRNGRYNASNLPRYYASNLPRSYPISDLPNILENYPDLDDLYKRSIKGLDLLGT